MQPVPYDIALEVISHIDPYDTLTLSACSLTHSSWTLPAQRRRFHTVEIGSREDMRRWHEFGARDRFIPCVRHLIYSGDEDDPLGPHDFLETYDGQFLSFNQLHTLEIRHLGPGWFDLESFRSAFGHLGKTLKALLISDATLTLNEFLGLLNLFPRLQLLGLDHFNVPREHSPVPSDLPPFRGTLNLSGPVNKYGLRFVEDLTRALPNFSSVRLRLNLNYHATRYLLDVPGFANHVTTMLLGYQDDGPESIDLSRCYNLRMLSIRTQQGSERLSTSLATQERFFRLLGTITSRQLEYIVIEKSLALSLMRYSTWGHLFKVLSLLQASCKRLCVILDSYEKFMAETFPKGETMARLLGCGNKGKLIS